VIDSTLKHVFEGFVMFVGVIYVCCWVNLKGILPENVTVDPRFIPQCTLRVRAQKRVW